MIPKGISIELGRDEKGWFFNIGKYKPKIRPSRYSDSVHAAYGGIKLDFMIGKITRPIPKFYKKEFWSTDYFVQEPATNPWNSGNHWFVFRFITLPAFFLSISLPFKKIQPGFYIGCKTSKIGYIEQALIDYEAMMKRNEETGVYSERAIYKWIGGRPNSDKSNYEIAWGTEKDRGTIILVPSFSVRDDLVDNF